MIEKHLKNYRVFVTKPALRQGEKLSISKLSRVKIIHHLRQLKYWPDNEEGFIYEKAFGAMEFKFYVDSKWVRVMVFKDDDSHIMWIFRVFAKKTNTLSRPDQIQIMTSMRRFRAEIRSYREAIDKGSDFRS